MAKKKPQTATEETTAPEAPQAAVASAEQALPPILRGQESAPATRERQPGEDDEPLPAALIHAPERRGNAQTIDNRLGYRKEDADGGRKRQIRFAKRPDDEALAPVRADNEISWANREQAWQARRDPLGLEAIDGADQKLRDLSRKRGGVPER